jgi:hypothetical protein
MKRLMMLLVTLAVAGVMVSTGPLAVAAATMYFFDFNNTLAPFQAFPSTGASDAVDSGGLALSPNCYVSQLNPSPTSRSNSCAQLTLGLEGAYATLMAPLKGHAITISVDFDARDLDGRGAAAVIVYAGSGKPAGVGSFQTVGPLLSTAWTHYGYQALLDGDNPVIAVGIRHVGDGPIFVQHAGIDNLRVRFLDY